MPKERKPKKSGKGQVGRPRKPVPPPDPTDPEEVLVSQPSGYVQEDAEFDKAYRQWKKTGDPDIREHLIERNRKLVRFLARQFRDRGEPLDDLVQVGTIGLINAVDRYDLTFGVKFSTFATPTIVGEIKRYFRDKGWSMKVPRRLQELNLEATKKIEELTQRFNRSPSYEEIATALGASEEEVIEALDMGQAYELVSLDREPGFGKEDGHSVLSDHLGGPDPDLESWELRMNLEKAMEATLDTIEQRVLQLAFYDDRSQTEIARELGYSQMHISRIQRRALIKLREYFRNSQ